MSSYWHFSDGSAVSDKLKNIFMHCTVLSTFFIQELGYFFDLNFFQFQQPVQRYRAPRWPSLTLPKLLQFRCEYCCYVIHGNDVIGQLHFEWFYNNIDTPVRYVFHIFLFYSEICKKIYNIILVTYSLPVSFARMCEMVVIHRFSSWRSAGEFEVLLVCVCSVIKIMFTIMNEIMNFI